MSDTSSPSPPSHGSAGQRTRHHRQAWSLAACLTGLAVLGGLWNWPSGRLAVTPGSTLDLTDTIELTAGPAPLTTVDGVYDGLTVRLAPLGLGRLLLHDLGVGSATVVPESAVRPIGIDPSVYEAYERTIFLDGGQVAAAVAERALGFDVSVTSEGLEVRQIEAGSPAAAGLAVGDVITAADGAPLEATTDLAAALQRAGGRPVTLTVTTGTASRSVPVALAAADGTTPRLGVAVTAASPEVDLEVPVTVDDVGVAGPSAGLLMALTVYDELSPVDVAAGRTVAGTGTLALDGTVGEIGGIEQKARVAEAAGADIFLAPASQATAARAVLGDRIPVVAVATFDDAVTALTGAAPAPTVAATPPVARLH